MNKPPRRLSGVKRKGCKMSDTKKIVKDVVDYGPQKTEDGEQKTEDRLKDLLKAEPVLSARLLEAFETGRWLVAVSFQKKYRPEDEHDLHHHYTTKAYPKNDVVSSLKHIASMFNAVEFPNAELPDKQQWH